MWRQQKQLKQKNNNKEKKRPIALSLWSLKFDINFVKPWSLQKVLQPYPDPCNPLALQGRYYSISHISRDSGLACSYHARWVRHFGNWALRKPVLEHSVVRLGPGLLTGPWAALGQACSLCLSTSRKKVLSEWEASRKSLWPFWAIVFSHL